jgi:Flp pilus assembly protein TadD/predicted Zn-dependent protease with MMP-like domain
MAVMTNTFRQLPLVLLAASAAVTFTSCKRREAGPSALAVAKSSVVPPATSVTAAMTAKPLDASEALRETRHEPSPPAAPCLETSNGRDPALPDLLEQASRDFEKGRYEDALECAREASRVDGQSVAAHHFRGAALSELGHIEEARTAYARALALDPDDPEVLRSVADLHVRKLGSRDDLELALAYVHRALPRAMKGKDHGLQKELYLLQAMALDDLGRPAEALAASSRSIELDPSDREARREKGVALFELCHFDQSRAELSRLATEEPDAWAEHYLGLIAERSEDDVAAAAHFSRAQSLDPDAFKPTAQASSSFFGQVVQEEIAKLPPDIRQGLSRSAFQVEDLPEVSDLVATDPPLSPGILGLFRPPAEGSPEDAKPAILLYRRNLARAAHTDEELRREVRDTLMHEVGHLNGEDDEQLRDRGL